MSVACGAEPGGSDASKFASEALSRVAHPARPPSREDTSRILADRLMGSGGQCPPYLLLVTNNGRRGAQLTADLLQGVRLTPPSLLLSTFDLVQGHGEETARIHD